MRVVILQSNYIPWKGYFDLIDVADRFVILDEVQYTVDWRNRNRIKTPNGPVWLTIPVVKKGRIGRTIDATLTRDNDWIAEHWQTIERWYQDAPFWDDCRSIFGPVYSSIEEQRLSVINRRFIDVVNEALSITTPLIDSREIDAVRDEGPTRRVLSMCTELGATEYLSGPAARSYLDVAAFNDAGIAVRFVDYGTYPEYPQLYGEFEHGVSIIDLIANVGVSAAWDYMRARSHREALVGEVAQV